MAVIAPAMRFNRFDRIPFWESKRRLQLLRTFRTLVVLHDDQVAHTMFDGPADTEESALTRSNINQIVDEVDRIVGLAGLQTTVTWTPPPMVGGYVQRVPVITNLFNLHRFQIPYQTVLDYVDRAVGIYERDQSSAWVRTFNPLFWLGLALDHVARLPFMLVRRAGFSTATIEDSWVGRSVRLVVLLLGGAASVVVILQAIGILDGVLEVLGFKVPPSRQLPPTP